jgi:hypothetical protein
VSSWLKREEFDKTKIVGTAIAALLTMGLAVVVRPILILTMQVTLYTWVTFLVGPVLGYFAQHSSDKLVSAICGGYIEPKHGNSLLLDALRTLIYAAIESGICALVIVMLMVTSK